MNRYPEHRHHHQAPAHAYKYASSSPAYHHPASYHPYKPRSIPYSAATPRLPSPIRRSHSHRGPLLPPIGSLTEGSLPLTRNSGSRRVDDSRRSSDPEKYSYLGRASPEHPYLSPQSSSSSGSRNSSSSDGPFYVKQEPRNYSPPNYRSWSFEDELPLTPISAYSCSPAMASSDNRVRSLDRMPHLHISEQRPRSRFDDYDDNIPSGTMSPAERRFMQTMPVHHPRPIQAYPVEYNWTEGVTATDSTAEVKNDAAALDPSLSSVRSSTDAATAAAAAAAVAAVTNANAAPELRLPETLGSAGASPAVDVTGESSTSQPTDAAGLLVPSDGLKKETPFSRSPELRISHKLAERKRRKEMRDLFDELREALPADRGMKASKWEILSKAVDYIAHLKNQLNETHRANEMLHRDLAVARGEQPGTTWPASYSHFTSLPQYVPPHNPNTVAATAAAATAAVAAATAAPVAAPASDAAPAVAAPAPAAPAVAAPEAAPAAAPAAADKPAA